MTHSKFWQCFVHICDIFAKISPAPSSLFGILIKFGPKTRANIVLEKTYILALNQIRMFYQSKVENLD